MIDSCNNFKNSMRSSELVRSNSSLWNFNNLFFNRFSKRLFLISNTRELNNFFVKLSYDPVKRIFKHPSEFFNFET